MIRELKYGNEKFYEKTKSKLGKSLENGFTRKSASNFSDLFLDEAPHQISIKKHYYEKPVYV